MASGGSLRSEERSRRRILSRMFGTGSEVADGVAAVFFESRGNALDLRDKSLIQQVSQHAQFKLPKLRHIGWRGEPILWAADVVAGSVARALARDEPAPFPVSWI